MLDERELAYYRSLTPGERLALGLELSQLRRQDPG